MAFEREKLLEALAYFGERVRNAGWIKLFKLVYYLDLVHLRQTGRTVTGLRYEAWPRGPVAPTLWRELKNPNSGIRQDFDVAESEARWEEPSPTVFTDPEDLEASSTRQVRTPGHIKAKAAFQHRYLTRRELQIAETLVEIFRDARAEQMSEASHNHRGPWDLARRRGRDIGSDAPTIEMLEGDIGLGRPEDFPARDVLLELIAERNEDAEIIQ